MYSVCALARFHLRKQRAIGFFFSIISKKRQRCIFFQIAREKEPERERERKD